MDSVEKTSGLVVRFLSVVERLGNALPHPASLFILLSLAVVLASSIVSGAGVSVVHPATGAPVEVVNLLSLDGLRRFVAGALPAFINFAPLGTVLMCLIGLAVAESSGLISACLRLVVQATSSKFLPYAVVFAGVMSNAGGDVGYVLLIPLAAILFQAVGRHPLAGLAAAFAGVSGGFSANLLLGTIDVLLAGITQEAARVVSPGIVVNPMANFYLMFVSTFVLTAVGGWVTTRVVEPRLGTYKGSAPPEAMTKLSRVERRGLLAALLALAVATGLVCAGLSKVGGGFLLDPKTPGFLGSIFVRHLVFFIFAFGLVAGLAYGIAARTIRSDHDVFEGMTASMKTMAGYIVLVFFIAQFVACFSWTNLGVVTAVKGAEFLRGLELGPIPLMVGFVLLAATVNLLIGSASAKWALIAPIFVPMFMLLGYSPELVQGAYRVGDSVTNIVTPLMAYFPLVLTFAQRYEPKAGIGTMVATMLPYSLGFFVFWVLLLIGWIVLGLPLGPGIGLSYPAS